MNDNTENTGNTTPNFRAHEHRYSDLPVKDVLKIRMKDLDIQNIDMQHALGYAKPNVIAMMKTGSMSLPANKAIIAARLLQLDPVFLLRKIIAENYPGLWDEISSVMGEHLVTKNEQILLDAVRSGLNGHDVNLVATPEFGQTLAPALAAIAKREKALAQAAIARTDDVYAGGE